MKRIFGVAMAVCIMAGSTLPAYAQDQDVGNMNGINSGTSTLTYEVDSNYAVVIPETINMNEQYSFTSRMMDLKDNESVVVFVDKSDEEITMTERTSGKTAKLHFNGGETDKFNRLILVRFSANQNTSNITFNGQMETTAGSYSGTCTFYVELQDSPIMNQWGRSYRLFAF